MPVDQEPDQPISVTVPVILEGGEELLHLGLGQMLPNPIGVVRQPATGRITLVSVLPKPHNFRRRCWPPEIQLVSL